MAGLFEDDDKPLNSDLFGGYSGESSIPKAEKKAEPKLEPTLVPKASSAPAAASKTTVDPQVDASANPLKQAEPKAAPVERTFAMFSDPEPVAVTSQVSKTTKAEIDELFASPLYASAEGSKKSKKLVFEDDVEDVPATRLAASNPVDEDLKSLMDLPSDAIDDLFAAPSKPAPKGKPVPKKPVQKDNLDDLFGMLDNNGAQPNVDENFDFNAYITSNSGASDNLFG